MVDANDLYGLLQNVSFNQVVSILMVSLGFCSLFVNRDVTGSISKISCWKILEPPLGNEIECISPNWSGGGMLHYFVGMRKILNSK